jgi:hypothetical protein
MIHVYKALVALDGLLVFIYQFHLDGSGAVCNDSMKVNLEIFGPSLQGSHCNVLWHGVAPARVVSRHNNFKSLFKIFIFIFY